MAFSSSAGESAVKEINGDLFASLPITTRQLIDGLCKEFEDAGWHSAGACYEDTSNPTFGYIWFEHSGSPYSIYLNTPKLHQKGCNRGIVGIDMDLGYCNCPDLRLEIEVYERSGKKVEIDLEELLYGVAVS
jgi:hypothetical protein